MRGYSKLSIIFGFVVGYVIDEFLGYGGFGENVQFYSFIFSILLFFLIFLIHNSDNERIKATNKSLFFTSLFYLLTAAIYAFLVIVNVRYFSDFLYQSSYNKYDGLIDDLIFVPLKIFLPFLIAMFFSYYIILRSDKERLVWKTPLKISVVIIIISIIISISSFVPYSFIAIIITLFNLIPALLFTFIFSKMMYHDSEKRIAILFSSLLILILIVNIIALSFSSFCLKIDTSCLARLAIKNRDASICERSQYVDGFYCYVDYAVKTGDVSICKQMGTSCYRHVAKETKDPAICKLIPPDTEKDKQHSGCCQDVYYDGDYQYTLTEAQRLSCGLASDVSQPPELPDTEDKSASGSSSIPQPPALPSG